MTKLVDSEKLREQFVDAACNPNDMDDPEIAAFNGAIQMCIDILDNAIPVIAEADLLGARILGRQEGYAEAQKQFEKPKGKWGSCYEYNNTGMYYRVCPFCYRGTITGDFDYCPHCGAKLEN